MPWSCILMIHGCVMTKYGRRAFGMTHGIGKVLRESYCPYDVIRASICPYIILGGGACAYDVSALAPCVLWFHKTPHSLLLIGQDIDKIYQYNVSSRSTDYHSTGTKRNNTANIDYFVNLLQKEKLVEPMEGRNFSSHPDIMHQCIIKSPSVLITKIVSHCIKLEKKKKSCCQ